MDGELNAFLRLELIKNILILFPPLLPAGEKMSTCEDVTMLLPWLKCEILTDFIVKMDKLTTHLSPVKSNASSCQMPLVSDYSVSTASTYPAPTSPQSTRCHGKFVLVALDHLFALATRRSLVSPSPKDIGDW